MKKIILICILSFVIIDFANAQIDSTKMRSISKLNRFNSKQYYLESSKTREIIGLSLLGVGTTIIIAGIDRSNHPQGWLDFTGAFMLLEGLLLNAVSIPLFISSAHKARKAAQL